MRLFVYHYEWVCCTHRFPHIKYLCPPPPHHAVFPITHPPTHLFCSQPFLLWLCVMAFPSLLVLCRLISSFLCVIHSIYSLLIRSSDASFFSSNNPLNPIISLYNVYILWDKHGGLSVRNEVQQQRRALEITWNHLWLCVWLKNRIYLSCYVKTLRAEAPQSAAGEIRKMTPVKVRSTSDATGQLPCINENCFIYLFWQQRCAAVRCIILKAQFTLPGICHFYGKLQWMLLCHRWALAGGWNVSVTTAEWRKALSFIYLFLSLQMLASICSPHLFLVLLK